jgi:hypothetical protein
MMKIAAMEKGPSCNVHPAEVAVVVARELARRALHPQDTSTLL